MSDFIAVKFNQEYNCGNDLPVLLYLTILQKCNLLPLSVLKRNERSEEKRIRLV